MPKVAPKITVEARDAALKHAMEARVARAAYKKDMESGKISMAQAIDDAREGNDVAGRMLVRQALMTQKGIGAAKTKQIMETIGISENRRLRGLGKSQAAKLIAVCSK